MRFLVLVAISFICSYASLSVQSYESNLGSPNLSMPRVQFSNNSQSNVNGFIAYYYFTSAEPNPVFEPYAIFGGNGSVEHVSGVNYRVKLDFSSVSIPAGSVFPNNSGIVFGLHYADWANWVKDDDYSNNMSQTMADNNAIVVTAPSGQILAGTYPNFNINTQPSSQEGAMAKVYALKDGENNFARIRLYVKNEGAIALNHFDFSVEITTENGQEPVFDAWYIPNTTYTVERKNDSVRVLHFSTSGVSLEPNSVFPSNDGIYFGIHYSNWSNVNTVNDYSLKGLQSQYSLANRIPLYIDGKLISGNPKIHNILDIKKIIADENNYSLVDFNRSVEELFAVIPEGNIDDFWDNVDKFFENVPNYDSTQQAVSQILARFPGLDTLAFVSLWKDIKGSYEQLVRLRIYEHYASKAVAPIQMLSKASSQLPPFLGGTCFKYPIAHLTQKEAWLLVLSPMKILGTKRASEYAVDWADDYAIDSSIYKGYDTTNGQPYTDTKDPFQNRADGFRHAVWNALLCRETGTQYDNITDCLRWAKQFTDAHESLPTSCGSELDSMMDIHNNAVGREKYRPHLSVGCQWFSIFGGCINEEVNGPSREVTKNMFLDLASKGYGFNNISQLSISPWISSIVFFKANNGKIYCEAGGKTDPCEPFEIPNTVPVKIGVLKKNPTVCNDEFTFYLDLEDEDNIDRIISGDENPPGIQVSKGGVRFTYCKLDIDGEYGSIPKVRYDYVVLRLSDNCPSGTYPFVRYHDCEDDGNNNSYSGDIGPNEINSNARLAYCFVPADENSVLEYPFADDYGVFANISSESIVHSKIKFDDEDDSNNNSWNLDRIPNNIQIRIKEIISGEANTIYNVVSYIVIVWDAIINFFFGG